MISFGELRRRFLMLLHRERFDADLDEEMRLHLELREQEQVKAGLEPEEAHYAARRRFGNAATLKEASHVAWGWTWFENLIQDLSYGLRLMKRSPGLTSVALLSLALGIGANTTIFSLLNALMLRSLPVEDPQHLVLFGHGRWVGSTDTLPNKSWDLFSYQFYRQISRETEVFSGIAAVNSIEFATHGSVTGADLEKISADLVSGSYFSVLGVKPVLGRTLTETDDQAPGGGPVAVASYSWWKRRFGNDPSVLGKTVKIESREYTIVGVTPPGFFGTTVGQSPDFWIPLSMEKEISPGWNGLNDKFFESLYLIARLKPGFTVEQASANTNLLFRQILRSEYVGPNPSQKELESIRHAQIELTSAARGLSQLRMQFSLSLEILMTVVGLVLLIACANIANLLLARSTARSREIAVRMALGATRARLLLQLLTESSLLAVVGALMGIAVAWKASRLLLSMASGGKQPLPLDVVPDLRVLLFTFLLTGLTAFLFGMAPALGPTKIELTPSLKKGQGAASAPTRNSLANGLIVSQVALSLVLLAGAGLFLRSLVKLSNVDVGFNKQNVLIFGLDEYAAGLPFDARLVALQEQIEECVQSLPGVRSASFAMFTFNQGEWSDGITVQGVPRTPENSHDLLYNVVGRGYFSTIDLPVLAGRAFLPQDKEHAPLVAVVNETMARTFFPGGSAVGHRFGLGDDPAHSGEIEIIGVVKDAKYVALGEDRHSAAYFPYSQHIQYFGNFVVRYSGDSQPVISEVRRAIAKINPNVLVSNVSTLAEQVDDSIVNQRMVAQLSTFFGLLAVFLVCIGIYGLMSYAVARRTNEIGIRMALGAARSNVQWLVMKEILRLLSAGLAMGIPVALGGAHLVARLEDPHLMSRMLFGLGPSDPLSLAFAIALMLAVAMLAGYLPARRASQVDPMVALRYE